MHRSDITALLRKFCDKGLLVAEGYGRGRKYHIQEPNLPTSEPNLPTSEDNVPTSEGRNVPTSNRNVPTSSDNVPTSEDKPMRRKKKDIYRLIIEYCEDYRTSFQIAHRLGMHEKHIRQRVLSEMIKEQLIEKLFPAIPNHPGQKYIRTAKGEAFLKEGEI